MSDSLLTLTPLLAPPAPVDRKLSRKLARRFQTECGRCYRNALRANDALRVTYVEGFAVWTDPRPSHRTPSAHGWLELSDGRVVDPTPLYCATTAPAIAYFPASRHPGLSWSQWLKSSPVPALPLHDFTVADSDRSRLAWRGAHVRAWRHAAALHEHFVGAPLLVDGEASQRELRAILEDHPVAHESAPWPRAEPAPTGLLRRRDASFGR